MSGAVVMMTENSSPPEGEELKSVNGQLMERVFDIQEQGVAALVESARSNDAMAREFAALRADISAMKQTQPKGFIAGVIAPVAKKVNAPAWMQSDNWTMRLFLTAIIILLVWLAAGREGSADLLYFLGDTLAKTEAPNG